MTPDGWRIRQLGEMCAQVSERAKGVDLPVLSVSKDLGIVLQSEKFKKRIASEDTSNYKRVRYDQFVYDPMLLWAGNVGRQRRVAEGVVSPAYTVFEANTDLDKDFFEYFLRQPCMTEFYKNISRGTNVRRQKALFSDFAALTFRFPPVREQRAIAAILSSMDDAIEATQAVIDQIQVVKKAMMAELLTRGLPGRHTRFNMTEIGEVPEEWEVARLETLTHVITKGESPGWQGFEYQREGVLFVTSENVRDAVLDLSAPKFIPKEFAAKIARSRLERGDVLVNIVGASIGRAALWEGQFPEANVNQAVAVVRPDSERLVPRLVLDALYSPRGQAYFGTSKVDNARPNVSLTNLRDFQMIVPKRDEQERIAAIADAMDVRVAREVQVLAEQRRTKAALMSVLLTGEVRVKPDEEAA